MVNDIINYGKNSSMLHNSTYRIFKIPFALLTKQRGLDMNLTAISLEIIINVSLSFGTKKYIKDKGNKR